jgi:hypothetical protein
MTIEPDTKDWTWVLQRPCPDCGLDTRSLPRDGIAGLTRATAAAWQDLLTGQMVSPGVRLQSAVSDEFSAVPPS